MSSHIPIAIAGGGPCGLALALQLAQRKIPCVLFEKKTGLSTHPKAMGISRRSAEIFHQLGILDTLYEPCRHLSEAPGVCLNIFARSFIGEEFGRIPLTEAVSPSFKPRSSKIGRKFATWSPKTDAPARVWALIWASSIGQAR